jgi:hypothetical protein
MSQSLLFLLNLAGFPQSTIPGLQQNVDEFSDFK